MARIVLEELSSALASPMKLTVPSQTHAVTAGDSSEMETGAGERTLDCKSDDSSAVYKATAWLIPCTSDSLYIMLYIYISSREGLYFTISFPEVGKNCCAERGIVLLF